MKMVKHDAGCLPPLDDAAQRRLHALDSTEVDVNDIPELTKAEIVKAVRGRFYKPVKKQVTARLDADVLAWLKQGGKGYQSRMNAILRQAMLEDIQAQTPPQGD